MRLIVYSLAGFSASNENYLLRFQFDYVIMTLLISSIDGVNVIYDALRLNSSPFIFTPFIQRELKNLFRHKPPSRLFLI